MKKKDRPGFLFQHTMVKNNSYTHNFFFYNFHSSVYIYKIARGKQEESLITKSKELKCVFSSIFTFAKLVSFFVSDLIIQYDVVATKQKKNEHEDAI